MIINDQFYFTKKIPLKVTSVYLAFNLLYLPGCLSSTAATCFEKEKAVYPKLPPGLLGGPLFYLSPS